MFDVVVFLACRNAIPEGPRGPGASFRLPFTLEGVSYTFAFDDPAAEPPAGLGEFWLYFRFFRRRGVRAAAREFGLRVVALNDDGSGNPVPHPAGSPHHVPYILGTIPFPAGQPVVSWAFPVRNLMLPRRGRYAFELLVHRRRPTLLGDWWSHIATHHILVE